MRNSTIITIPKRMTGLKELVVLPREEFERLSRLGRKEQDITEEDVLRWSREAKKLKRVGKLGLFEDLIRKGYPRIARKYEWLKKK